MTWKMVSCFVIEHTGTGGATRYTAAGQQGRYTYGCFAC